MTDSINLPHGAYDVYATNPQISDADMSETLTMGCVVLGRALVLLRERGWQRDGWATGRFGPVLRGSSCRTKHRDFSVPGAIAAICYDLHPQKADLGLYAAAWAAATDGMMSALICSDVSAEALQALSMPQRVALCAHAINTGSSFESLAMWNKHDAEDFSHVVRVMEKATAMHELALTKLKARSQ